jgi:hypothetical protein
LAAKRRPANIDASAGSVEEMARIVARIRQRWPKVRILLRADSGFARETLMTWCENNAVDFLFGLAKNARLNALELAAAQEQTVWPRGYTTWRGGIGSSGIAPSPRSGASWAR